MESIIIPDTLLKRFLFMAGEKHKTSKNILFRKIYQENKDSFSVLVSIGMLGYKIHSYKFTKHNDIEPDNSFDYVVSNVLQNYNKRDVLRKYLLTIPSLYVRCIQLLFSNKFHRSKLEDLAVESGVSILNYSNLISKLPKPTFSPEMINISGLDQQEIQYPAIGVHVNIKYSKYSIGYIDIDGIVVRSNVLSSTIRNTMLSKAVHRQGRLYFLYMHSAKNRLKGATAFMQVVDNKVIPIIDKGEEIATEVELKDFIKQHPRKSKFILSTSGIVEIKYKRYTKVLKAIDYTIDEDTYDIVKLHFEIKGKEYSIPVSNLDEITLNKSLFKVIIYEWGGDILALHYAGKYRW